MISRVWVLIKRILIVLLCLAALLAGALFEFENPNAISPVFWGLSFPPLSVGYYLIFTFIFGILLGACLVYLSSGAAQRDKSRQLASLTRQLQKSRSEIAALTVKSTESSLSK